MTDRPELRGRRAWLLVMAAICGGAAWWLSCAEPTRPPSDPAVDRDPAHRWSHVGSSSGARDRGWNDGVSPAVYPPERIAVRFDHRLHAQAGVACLSCHPADASTKSSDRLVPLGHGRCVSCHAIDEKDPAKVARPTATCIDCHRLGDSSPGSGAFVASAWPSPHIAMDHRRHHEKGIACERCHLGASERGLLTRDDLPSMRVCLECHRPEAREPSGACVTCHETERDGLLRTLFGTGVLTPPRWMRGAHHGADWLYRHRVVAGTDSSFCGQCHRESECADCHDGRVRPRDVHPNDWLSMHAVGAKLDQPRCATCHQASSFCGPCHARAGVAMSSPLANRDGARVHPDPAIWSGPRRGPGHHAIEAQRNLAACVGCHVERDCVTCHGTRAIGGVGVTPHEPGFGGRCGAMLQRNARPCLVCHEPGDGRLEQCR